MKKTLLFNISNKDMKHLFIIFNIIILCYLSLLRIDDFFYEDDNVRKAYGGAYFLAQSRWLSEIFAYLFTIPARNFFTFSPISQIFAIITLSVSGLILCKVFTTQQSLTTILSASIIGIYPFFYGNILYSFDAFFMALSIFFSVAPFLYYQNKYYFFLISLVGLVGMLTTYQQSSGVYPSIAILIALKLYFLDKHTLKSILQLLSVSFFAYILALVIFKVLIYTEFNGHVSTKMITLDTANIILINIKTYINFIIQSLGKNFIFYFTIFLMLYFIARITTNQSSIRKKIIALIITTFSLLLIIILSAGIPILMETYPTSLRYLLGINPIVCTLVLIILERSRNIFKIIILIFIVNLIALGNILGNAINDQWQYDKFRIYQSISSLSPFLTENYTIILQGTPSNHQSFNQNSNLYPLISQLANHSNLSKYGANEIFSRYLPIIQGNNEECPTNSKEGLVFSNTFNKIYKDNHCFYLIFK